MHLISSIRKFGRFIVRIIRWMPIIWKQEDWDFEYMYDLLEIKMKDIQNCLRKDKLHVGSDKHVREISICLGYMDRYRNSDKYLEKPAYAKHMEVEDILTNLGEYRITSFANKYINFEKENFRMFWKCFVKWHTNWWC